MGKRTSIYLTDVLNARIEQSGMTPLRLIEYALDQLGRTPPAATFRAPRPAPAHRPAETAPRSAPTPAEVTYSRIRNALGQSAGTQFTASAVAESLGITHHLAVGRLRYLAQLGMAQRLDRAAGPGHPYAYRLVKIGQRRLCAEGQCDHAHHTNRPAEVANGPELRLIRSNNGPNNG